MAELGFEPQDNVPGFMSLTTALFYPEEGMGLHPPPGDGHPAHFTAGEAGIRSLSHRNSRKGAERGANSCLLAILPATPPPDLAALLPPATLRGTVCPSAWWARTRVYSPQAQKLRGLQISEINNSYEIFLKIKINIKIHSAQDTKNLNKDRLHPVPNSFSSPFPNSGHSYWL